MPARDAELPPEAQAEIKANYREIREKTRASHGSSFSDLTTSHRCDKVARAGYEGFELSS